MSITTKIVVLHINLRQLELFRYSNSKSLQSLSICQIIFRHRPRDWEKRNFTQNYSIERKQNASTKSQSINHSVETSEATRFSEWWNFLQGNRKHLESNFIKAKTNYFNGIIFCPSRNTKIIAMRKYKCISL